MKPLAYFNVAAQQVTTQSTHLLRLRGYFRGATADRWLQIHDSSVTPAESSVPVAQKQILQELAFDWEFEVNEFPLTKGLYVCVSTTEGTKTLSSDKMDLDVELADPEAPSGLTVAGDLTTGVSTRQVWADSAGPKRLVKLEIGENSITADVTRYLQLFAHDSPADGSTPLAEWPMTHNMTAETLSFGADGREVYSLSGSTVRDGCTLCLSDTAGTLTQSSDTVVIKASYK